MDYFKVPNTLSIRILIVLIFVLNCVFQTSGLLFAKVQSGEVNARLGFPVNLSCESSQEPRAITQCTWIRKGRTNLQLEFTKDFKPTQITPPGYSYWVDGLEQGICRVLITNVTTQDFAVWHCSLVTETMGYEHNIAVLKTPTCEGVDKYRNVWIAYANDTAVRNCSKNLLGSMSWVCLSNGRFEGNAPNTDNCKAPAWLDSTEKLVEESIHINTSTADTLLTLAETKTSSSRNEAGESVDAEYSGDDISRVMALGGSIVKRLPNNTSIEIVEDFVNRSVGIIRKVLENEKPWEDLGTESKLTTSNSFILAIEDTGLELASRVMTNGTLAENYGKSFRVDNEFEFTAGVQAVQYNYSIVFPENAASNESYMEVSEYFSNESTVSYVGIRVDHDRANRLFPPAASLDETKKTFINSDILSFSFAKNTPIKHLTKDGVRIKFRHSLEAQQGTSSGKCNKKPGKRADLGSSVCVYWDTHTLNWSTAGCKLVKSQPLISVCECSHLTSFALLMDLHRHSEQDSGLEIITWILLPLSCLGLATSVMVLLIIEHSRSIRNLITTNLCSCLLLGNLMLLIFMDRSYMCPRDGMCSLAATLMHFLFLSAFSWMAMEGVFLYQRIFLVFDSGRTYTRLRYVIAYGIPTLIVSTTWIVSVVKSEQAYGTEDFCWLSKSYIWAFMGPILIVVLGNMTLLGFTLKKSYDSIHKSKVQAHRDEKQCCFWIKGGLTLTILLGITWILGFALLVDDAVVGAIGAYLFTILNASQGMFLFTFNVVMDTRIRALLRRHFSALYMRLSSDSSTRTDLAQTP